MFQSEISPAVDTLVNNYNVICKRLIFKAFAYIDAIFLRVAEDGFESQDSEDVTLSLVGQEQVVI